MINGKQTAGRARGRARLQERDLELLGALEHWGVLGLGQIDGLLFHKELPEGERAGLLFNEYTEKTYRLSGYKRLQDLRKSGHVAAHFYRDFPVAFTLSGKGHRALLAAGRARFPGFRRSVSGFIIEHEVMVNAVGLVLSKLRGLTVRTIRERTDWNSRGGWSHNTSRSNIPDLWISDERQPKAVEVELNKKSAKWYPGVWENYRAQLPAGAAVLYLTDWPSGPDFMKRQAGKLGMGFIYVCALADFRASAGRSAFMNCEGRTLRLETLAAPITANLTPASPAWTSNVEILGGVA